MGCNGVGDSGILAMQGCGRAPNPAVLTFKVRSLNRHVLPVVIFAAMGCNWWALAKMYALIEVLSDTRTMNPWITWYSTVMAFS